MADISQELSAIKNSVYGKNMRNAIHDAIQKVNNDSGGSGATIDTLWDDSNGATVGTEYTMTGNIDDYDTIVLKVGSTADIAEFNSYDQYHFVVAMIGAGEQIQCCGYGERYLTVTVSDNKFTVMRSGAIGENIRYTPVLWQIVGIKY